MRKDSENLAIIERLKPQHAALNTKVIRFGAELERSERDLEELLAELDNNWGTRDLAKVRELVVANYETNTKIVDDYSAVIQAVTENLAAVEAKS